MPLALARILVNRALVAAAPVECPAPACRPGALAGVPTLLRPEEDPWEEPMPDATEGSGGAVPRPDASRWEAYWA